jgi:hypothetical protein
LSSSLRRTKATDRSARAWRALGGRARTETFTFQDADKHYGADQVGAIFFASNAELDVHDFRRHAEAGRNEAGAEAA